MSFIVFNQINGLDNLIKTRLSDLVGALKSLNKSVFFLDEFKEFAFLQDVKDYIISIQKGIIYGSSQDLEYRDLLLKFVKKFNFHIILELPENIFLDINNFLPFEDTIFIGINDKVNSDAGTFLYRHLVVKRNLFKEVIGIRCLDSDLIDIFRIIAIDNKKYLFMNPNFLVKDALLFNESSASFFNVKKLKSGKKFFEVKAEETSLKHLRFFIYGKNVLLFDDAFRLKSFFEEQKFNIFLLKAELRNKEVYPFNLIREFY
ncbi:MAG: hypothetical protein PWP03_311 [Candidatus Woesearchaeota archaeon]|nr:hypothetical protein [Candidatus Woesearchaeota archaeon]MDN5327673.1 hypothetical protein [Candidatus Woesearchaeota archaeon]